MSPPKKPLSAAGIAPIVLLWSATLYCGCASSEVHDDDLAQVVSMLQSTHLRHTPQYDAAVQAFSITPEQARIAADRCSLNAGLPDTLFNEPSMVIDGNYFFASKHKTRILLRGVLVNGRTGDTALLETNLAVMP